MKTPLKLTRYLALFFLSLAMGLAAGLEGRWAAEFDTQVGLQKYVFEFETTHGTRLEGKAQFERMEQKGETLLKELKLADDTVSFVEIILIPDMELRVTYVGKLAGDELKLTRTVGDFATEQLVAKRVAPAAPPMAAAAAARELAPGPFQPTWESLAQNYRAPEWFRDAKFGIWAHWSAQCVPEEGDWYARQMYTQGHRNYEHAVKTYGHPSEVGFMEIENRWKAENWDPEKLMNLYVRAGAKYFVALANHHDNFDAYDSKHHAWNSVNVGPKKDIVGTWEKIARARGLRFGVSNHSAHAWHWFQTAYGYDAEGPKAGVRYDAFKLKKEDGKGKWWEGLDPQELYTGPNLVMPHGITTIKAANEWHERNDRRWTERAPEMNPTFTEKWFLRTQDLVDKYRPDLVYFDNFALPLGQAGLDIAAHYYNASLQWHGGQQEAVLNIKGVSPERRGAVIDDIERGVAEGIRPAPWQTDTCIGSWHYERSIYTRNRYKTVAQVVRMLTDIVSKNGNLLLSIPVRGDGTIDELEVAFLEGMARWMDVNGEAIFATRPWAVYGEGPSVEEKAEAGHFGGARDVRSKPYTSADLRFTAKGDTLYAVVMELPTEKTLLVKSLATPSPHIAGRKVTEVSLLGHPGKLAWSQDEGGLRVELPAELPSEHAIALRIKGVRPSLPSR
ncbi:MAG TPA: alpha-L-fucosidase [Opitutaceae bacterium]|nr:alpha-L-fucosidase [Opitutaceae bacterium]